MASFVCVSLRSYQSSNLEELFSVEERRLLYVLPTGGGKTNVAVAMMKRSVERGEPVLALAHRRELVGQMAERLAADGLPAETIGVVMAGELSSLNALVQVASIDTVGARGSRPPAKLIVVDEAHHAPADKYDRIIADYPDAVVLGLTATPWRHTGRGLAGSFDRLIAGPSMAQLIADGWLMEPRVFSVPDELMPRLSGVKVSRGDYAQDALAKECERADLVGAIVPHWQKHAGWRRTVVYAVNRRHAQMIAEQFTAAGVPTGYLDGETPIPERKRMLERIGTGELRVIVNVGVLTEGWDCPPVKCIVLARPTRSLALYLQMAGRALRPGPTGETPIILDHSGAAREHGLPQRDREWSLTPKVRKAGSGGPLAKRCACGCMVEMSVKSCPVCGYEWPASEVRETDGELVEVRETKLRKCEKCGGDVVFRGGLGKRFCDECSTCPRCNKKVQGALVFKMHERGFCFGCLSSSDPSDLPKCKNCGDAFMPHGSNDRHCHKCLHCTTCNKKISIPTKYGVCLGCQTPEHRSETARLANAAMTPEQRSNVKRKVQAAMTPEQRSSAKQKMQAAMTPEQRSASARKRIAAQTKEQLSERAHRSWATRRANSLPDKAA